MKKLRVLDLFSGIGGFSLGLERTGGFETVAFCEIEPFPRKVLAKHWPGVPQYDDVRTLTADVLARDGIAVDVITGGFPCQDLSVAGKQRGMGEGTRSGLWSEIVRLIGELRPRYVIVENVAALLAGPSEKRGGWFGRVLGDLAECGYDAEWENIPAAALGAPHRRERVWLLAYPNSARQQQGNQEVAGRPPKQSDSTSVHATNVADAAQVFCDGSEYVGEISGKVRALREPRGSSEPHDLANASQIKRQGSIKEAVYGFARLSQQPERGSQNIGRVWATEPDVGRVAYGVPDRSHRLAALGNAVVPQIPELIGHAILQAETAV